MKLLLTFALAIIVSATIASAQPMRCGDGIINPGDSQERVIELCGQPTGVRQWVDNVVGGDDAGPGVQVPMVEWTYIRPGQFAKKIIFQGGRVQEIKDAGMPSVGNNDDDDE